MYLSTVLFIPGLLYLLCGAYGIPDEGLEVGIDAQYASLGKFGTEPRLREEWGVKWLMQMMGEMRSGVIFVPTE